LIAAYGELQRLRRAVTQKSRVDEYLRRIRAWFVGERRPRRREVLARDGRADAESAAKFRGIPVREPAAKKLRSGTIVCRSVLLLQDGSKVLRDSASPVDRLCPWRFGRLIFTTAEALRLIDTAAVKVE